MEKQSKQKQVVCYSNICNKVLQALLTQSYIFDFELLLITVNINVNVRKI